MHACIKVAIAVASALCNVVGAWGKARFSRSVWLKVGEVEVEAPTVAEAKSLLKEAREFQQRTNPPTRRDRGAMESRVKLIRKKEPKA